MCHVLLEIDTVSLCMQAHYQQAEVQVTPAFLSVDDAIRFSSISRSGLYQLMRDGKVRSHCVQVSGSLKGRRLVNRQSLLAYIESHNA
jgi:hypothetical protein